MNKGQLSVFIILGLFIFLILFGLMGYFTIVQTAQIQEEQAIQEQVIQEAARVKIFSENCLAITAENAIKKIGPNGGYSSPPLTSQDTAIWLTDQINIQPTLTQIKQEIETEIENNVGECLQYETFLKEGLNITSGSWGSEVIFARGKVIVELDFPIEISRSKYVTEYQNFQTELQIPFRQMFEVSSQIINLQLKPEFKKFAPLLGLNTSFAVSYENHGDIYVYTVAEKGVPKPNSIKFATKFGRSELKKVFRLPPNSNLVPLNLPMSVDSVDKMASLSILPGTTINLDSEGVDALSVRQRYDTQVIRDDIPIEEHEDDSVSYGNQTWDLKYPIYTWGPDGTRFNSPQRLVMHWDEDETPRQGELGILYNGKEGWKPIPAEVDYTNNFLYTDLPGFSETTIYDCGISDRRNTRTTTAKIDETGGCIARLVGLIVVLIILILATILTFGAGISTFPLFIGSLLMGHLSASGIAIAIVSIAGGIIGGFAINGAVGYSADIDSISFTPSCNQKIDIDIFNDGGSGTCSIEDGKEVQRGETLTLTSEIKSCNAARSMFCMKCKVRCRAQYK